MEAKPNDFFIAPDPEEELIAMDKQPRIFNRSSKKYRGRKRRNIPCLEITIRGRVQLFEIITRMTQCHLKQFLGLCVHTGKVFCIRIQEALQRVELIEIQADPEPILESGLASLRLN